jgi:hypothetical protein
MESQRATFIHPRLTVCLGVLLSCIRAHTQNNRHYHRLEKHAEEHGLRRLFWIVLSVWIEDAIVGGARHSVSVTAMEPGFLCCSNTTLKNISSYLSQMTVLPQPFPMVK